MSTLPKRGIKLLKLGLSALVVMFFYSFFIESNKQAYTPPNLISPDRVFADHPGGDGPDGSSCDDDGSSDCN